MDENLAIELAQHWPGMLTWIAALLATLVGAVVTAGVGGIGLYLKLISRIDTRAKSAQDAFVAMQKEHMAGARVNQEDHAHLMQADVRHADLMRHVLVEVKSLVEWQKPYASHVPEWSTGTSARKWIDDHGEEHVDLRGQIDEQGRRIDEHGRILLRRRDDKGQDA